MTTPALELFRAEYLRYVENYDPREEYSAKPAVLAALSPAEQEQAARELLAAVRAGRFDNRAVCGLGYLRCAEALPLLHRLLRRANYIINVLGAIARIEPTSLDPEVLVALLTPGLYWWPPLALFSSLIDSTFPLVDALRGLRYGFIKADVTPRVVARVLALLANPDGVVRLDALDTLRSFYANSPSWFDPVAEACRDRSRDELFHLVRADKQPASYQQAQQLFLAGLPAAERAALQLASLRR